MGLLLPVIAGSVLTLLVLVVRIWLLLSSPDRHRPARKGHVSLLVVAGSGGHTTEILRLLSSLSTSYSPVHYVLAETDKMSEDKIHSFESAKVNGTPKPLYTIHRIPRSREVRQSWSSSVLTTIQSFLYSFPLTARLKPDLVLCNGPGTCIPVCFSALLLGIFGIKKVILVYVESLCRVDSLSLSGKLLYYFADYFIVQWPLLQDKYPKSIYLGRIV
ncbi:PREDICTED: UDP-N-acetylglucosamine transferase subunit ALG14 homolog [Nanorana parkeri]|uniref:UDP-N-acetylglucosamine transferase subunit ALG14 homolog n=1 Tax=Nanorana parkeri TaxID=125878 RepID=UPI00085460F1|nr:PREDICTED: UDP-N-acetylglucosamine transferase subunit ALG14 homolog [Nanorana parkeri]